MTVTYTPPVAPSITSTGPAVFTIGAGGSYRITATGTPSPTLSLDDPSDLPAGLTFTSSTGSATISGTPSGPARTVTVTVRAHGGGSDATQSLAVEIAGGTVSTGGGTVSAGGGAPAPPVSTTTSPSGTPVVGVQLACTGPASSSCGGQVAVTTKVKHHKKPVVVGRATYTIQAGQVKIVKVTLNGKGRKLLKKHHRLKVTVVISVTTTNGLRHAATETITLRQHKHKHKHKHK